MAFARGRNIRTSHTESQKTCSAHLHPKTHQVMKLYFAWKNRTFQSITHGLNNTYNIKKYLHIVVFVVRLSFVLSLSKNNLNPHHFIDAKHHFQCWILVWNVSKICFHENQIFIYSSFMNPPLSLFTHTSELTTVMWRYRSKTVYFSLYHFRISSTRLNLAFTHA